MKNLACNILGTILWVSYVECIQVLHVSISTISLENLLITIKL